MSNLKQGRVGEQLLVEVPFGAGVIDVPAMLAVDGGGVPIGASNVPAAAYTPGTAFDARSYGSVTFSCTVVGTVAWNLQWSPDGTTWPASGSNVTGIDLNNNTATSIGLAAPTAVFMRGGGFVRLLGGTGGTFTLSAAQ